MKSGLYIVRLLNNNPMPVTRDPRYVDACARVSSDNIKVGKAKDFDIRQKNYWKDFDKKNVVFEPLVKLDDINTAERAVLQKLKKYRKLSPKGGKLEWLEGITYENAKKAVFEALDESEISFVPIH
jgi:hypothetical protein